MSGNTIINLLRRKLPRELRATLANPGYCPDGHDTPFGMTGTIRAIPQSSGIATLRFIPDDSAGFRSEEFNAGRAWRFQIPEIRHWAGK